MLNALETRRNIFHLIFGIVLVDLIYLRILDWLGLLVLLLIGLALSLISRKWRIPVIGWLLDKFERPEVIKKFPGKGMIYYVAGALLSVLFFERNIALASITILALGDSIAPLVGQFGKLKHPFSDFKFMEGALFGTVVAFIGAVLFVKPWEAMMASVVAMIVEGVDLKLFGERVDDNVVVPVVAGIVIVIMRFFWV